MAPTAAGAPLIDFAFQRLCFIGTTPGQGTVSTDKPAEAYFRLVVRQRRATSSRVFHRLYRDESV